MADTLFALDRPDELDTKGWDINFGQLLTPKREVHPYIYLHDQLYESPDNKFACLFYTINEYRMGASAGLVGIFENKNDPTLLANPKNQWFDFQGRRSLIFSDNFLFLRKLAYNQNEKLSGMPIVAFNLTEKAFAFVDFDVTSIYYSPLKISDTIYQFNLDTPEEMKHINLPNRHGQTFDLLTLKFYPFEVLHKIMELYQDEKKNAC